MTFEHLLIEAPAEGVSLIRLNRPQALNALNKALLDELGRALEAAEQDSTIRCVVLTGSDKAFAAGADIKELAGKTYADVVGENLFAAISRRMEQFRKPLIAAVSGYALGGGCELAMLCDFIIAADTARFGQPEINLGLMAGIGGTQRLTRLVGKSKAMDMILTGRQMDSTEALQSGLVSRVVPPDRLIPEALAAASQIAAQSPLAAMLNKQMVDAAYETTLAAGLELERRVFHSLFAFDDYKEGVAAFIEKRKPVFKGR